VSGRARGPQSTSITASSSAGLIDATCLAPRSSAQPRNFATDNAGKHRPRLADRDAKQIAGELAELARGDPMAVVNVITAA
jgi:hypothetical protein